MESSKLTALLFILISFSSTPLTLACNTCPTPTPATPKPPTTTPPITPPITLPPILPPIIFKPPGTLPPILPPITGKPPVTGKPPGILPPIPKLPPGTLPPIPKLPPGILPPLPSIPPIALPPVGPIPIIGGGGGGGGATPPSSPGSPCPPPASTETCPLDTLKLGACVNLLGNTVHLGDPSVECCPIIEGLTGVSAALCLCTALKASALDLNLVLPIALKLLITCGNPAPKGYTCS